MKSLAVVLSMPCPAASVAADRIEAAASHRYIVERTFPAGALDGLDAGRKAQVNRTDARFGVRWLTSHANAARPGRSVSTKARMDGPDERAIRGATVANALPVDSITEVPATLDPH